ncbi:NAD(+) synthase [Absiella sp. AM29-15]|uniref:NAD(+) synthase n=1 Tax=Absiella sp. AM29-15 TaxID=2292278 RepID=UPI000E401077|nr:NAD(+) synthase [Absiella sp. AM29-15]RGC45061.1 NAD(+) synthase [Absiella sp. AM29-15]
MQNYGYFKVACATPALTIGDVHANTQEILHIISTCDQDVRLIVFPELSLCGYTCQDLLYENILMDSMEEAIFKICQENTSDAIIVIGCALRQYNHLYNCAVFIHQHSILGIIPKTYLPNYNEFYEKRWFSSADSCIDDDIYLHGQRIPFSSRILIHDETSGAIIGADICEDLWVPIPPSTYHTLHGANVIVNLSASNETIGKKEYRRNMILSHSTKCMCGYVYASAGIDESTSDLVFSGHAIIADNGYLVHESEIFHRNKLTYGEIDLEKLKNDRLRFSTYMELSEKKDYQFITCQTKPVTQKLELIRTIDPYPFVPKDEAVRKDRCMDILHMQATGLAQRLKKINCSQLIIGISGGLDSTLALIVAKIAFDMNGFDTKGILAVTMPGFGTSERTLHNAQALMEALHTTQKNIDIRKACELHYKDIEHDATSLDITFENVQARERTQILMDLANQHHGIVLGTGDLSELALGWCTYNGDHMSMYAVNASIPKTLIRYLLVTYAHYCRMQSDQKLADILDDICDTPVSPELLPPKENGEIAQITEDAIGSYTYHDFFLYHMLRNHFSPDKIYQLALLAFGETHKADIKSTLKTFYHRFFTQQFKRNCMPDGVKVGSVCLSPRGDWRMPSDASADLWLKEVDQL